MIVLPAGGRALLAEFDDLDEALSAYRALLAAPPRGAIDIVPAARTVLVSFDPGATDEWAVRQALVAAQQPASVSAGDPGPLVELPVIYDGADLAEVARLTGLSVDGVVEAHGSAVWTVAFCGFAPGFAYLAGGGDRLAVPRRATPRTHVPAGAVGLAGGFSGVYPRESPGGWQLIGRTDAVLWDAGRMPPALLSPGTRVRFVPEPPGGAAP
ncbi:5-oxoprolinase subunit B family protein [Compostimonas suwonensis]|uniref:KipI family sensor histidine kinase inhibitor n=1 Tax=Compostimonas suwonensis TaxID=1048394 RepID=A0A2M9BYL5_9MICO|nr:allophanate hydrolase subunit 1 [Compostimonas suwonensis]PJJ63172.1 KipI family sensor histidine kinase inhibitor [Compostimonas suwonensis]